MVTGKRLMQCFFLCNPDCDILFHIFATHMAVIVVLWPILRTWLGQMGRVISEGNVTK